MRLLNLAMRTAGTSARVTKSSGFNKSFFSSKANQKFTSKTDLHGSKIFARNYCDGGDSGDSDDYGSSSSSSNIHSTLTSTTYQDHSGSSSDSKKNSNDSSFSFGQLFVKIMTGLILFPGVYTLCFWGTQACLYTHQKLKEPANNLLKYASKIHHENQELLEEGTEMIGANYQFPPEDYV